jgi:hypothetical protein
MIRRVVLEWFALKRQKARRLHQSGAPEVRLPAVVQHASAGFPGSPFVDDIYLEENPGTLVSDAVELAVFDPSNNTIHGDQPTQTDWESAFIRLISFDGALGRWHYEDWGVGQMKTDGDVVWTRARFRRAGLAAGAWGGAVLTSWSY